MASTDSSRSGPYPWVRMMMQVVVSLAVLLASLWVVVSQQYESSVENFAYVMIGTVIGYWLR